MRPYSNDCDCLMFTMNCARRSDKSVAQQGFTTLIL